jgi:hypothetical protein
VVSWTAWRSSLWFFFFLLLLLYSSIFLTDICDGALLRCSTRLPTFTGSILCSFLWCHGRVVGLPFLRFCFVFFFFPFDTFDGALLRHSSPTSDVWLGILPTAHFPPPLFAVDVTCRCLSFPDMDTGSAAHRFFQLWYFLIWFFNVVSFVSSSIFWRPSPSCFLYSSSAATALSGGPCTYRHFLLLLSGFLVFIVSTWCCCWSPGS